MNIYICDLDGTLLDSNKRLPEDFKETLELIKKNNDMFFIASGRSYEDVCKYYKDIDYPINAICDNGAEVYIDGVSRYQKHLIDSDSKKIIDKYLELDFGILMLSTSNQTYRIMPTNYDTNDDEMMKEFYLKSIEVKSYKEIESPILKIAIGTNKGANDYLYNDYTDLVLEATHPVVSGFGWIDFVHNTVNKGTGINHMLELLGLDSNDAYCFGDYLNDITMVDCSKHTFAMKNSHQTILDLFDEVIDSNDNWGVTKKIKEIINTKNAL